MKEVKEKRPNPSNNKVIPFPAERSESRIKREPVDNTEWIKELKSKARYLTPQESREEEERLKNSPKLLDRLLSKMLNVHKLPPAEY